MATETTNEAEVAEAQAQADFARRLRAETAAVRCRRRVLGNTRTLDASKRREIADQYSADPDYIRARKVLLNRKDPRIKACFSVCERAIKYWESMTVPYSHAERGIRLIRRNRIEEFENGMRELVDELSTAVAEADEAYAEVLQEAQERLADLFNRNDYPESLIGCWGIDWEYPSVEPPDYLQRLNPQLYEHEQQRIRRRFEQAVELTEQAFMAEFAKMIERLSDRLQPDAEGNVKRFNNSTVENLREFFDRFGQMNVGSNSELDALVDQAKEVIAQTNVAALRKDVHERQTVGQAMQGIAEQLEGMMVDRPDREINLDDDDE